MNIDIHKAENGWMIVENQAAHHPELGKWWVFKTLEEMSDWIRSNAMALAPLEPKP